MADEPADYTTYAGRLVFPKTPADLTDPGRCPACLNPLHGATVCPACRLDLNHPAAGELRDLSTRAADSLLRRANLIGRMRYETDQLIAQGARPSATAPPPPPAPAPVASTTASAPGGRAGTTVPGAVASASVDKPRRSSVQVSLLVVGVSLLSIAAVFFLIYAFIMFGLVWRSLIIGSITVAAIIAASMLRGRKLTATAEGIAVFGVVLVYLDAWALKANNMLGLGNVDDELYWGCALVLTAVGFVFWHRRTLLRAPNIAAFAALAPGLGLLAAGLASDADNSRQVFIGFAAAGVAGIAHVAAHNRRFERTVLLTVSLGATVIAAFLAPWAGPTAPGSYGYGPLIAAAVAAIVLASILRTRTKTVFAILFAIVTGTVLASAITLGGARIDSGEFWLFVPLVSATAVTLLGEYAWRRATAAHVRRPLGAAALSAAVVTGISAVTPVGVAGLGAIFVAAEGPSLGWRLDPTNVVTGSLPAEYPWALVAVAAAATLAIAAAAINKTLTVSLPIALWALTLTAVGAVPLLARLDAIVSGWLALATLALIALFLLRHRQTVRARYRVILVALAAASSVLSLALSWANRDLWWTTTLAIIALLLFSRMLTRTAEGKAGLVGVAASLTLLFAGSVATRLTHNTNPLPQVELVNYVTLTCAAATILVLVSAIPLGRAWSALDRRTVFWLAFAVAAIGFGARSLMTSHVPHDALAQFLLPEWITSLALALALLTGLSLWVFVPTNKALRVERVAASVAATPALFLIVTAFTRALGLPATLDAIAPISAALLGAAASLAVTLTRPSSVPRWAREVGVALVAVPALVGALRTDTGLAWLALVLAGVTALLLAIDRQGLFTSASPRRHYGWLALALGTAGLWWRLRGDQVTALEPYVLPLAAALIIIALLIARASHSQTSTQDAAATDAAAGSLAAPAVALGGALVALVPLGINGATGTLERPVIVAAASAVLLLAGSFVVASRAWQRWLDAAALAGAIGLIVTVVGRAVLTRDPVTVDAWVAALFVVLLAAAFGQARTRIEDRAVTSWRTTAGVTLAIVALTAVLLIEAPQFDLRLGTVRALAVLLLFAVIHLIAFIVDVKPLTPLVGWVAIAYAALVGIVGAVTEVLDPLELATVPIAIALLTTGAHQLATVPTARSWPWLAPGLVVLLVPSLLATATVSPQWRLVGLGVVAIAALVIGAVKRLQAPFLIGAVVALWHGVATLQPQLRAAFEAVPWWLWTGAGGILLIVLAARYEKRIANLKSVAMKFAALR